MKIILLLLLVAFATAKVSYDGHEVWRIQTKNRLATNGINDLVTRFNLDVWSHSPTHIDVRVSPELKRVLKVELAHRRLAHSKMIPDLGTLVREEEERLAAKPYAFSLTDYNTFEDIETYLSSVDSSSPYATLTSLGLSLEGRDIWQLKISVGAGKPSVWVDCDIHAREWVSGATCLYGIDLLTNNYGTDPDVTALLDAYDVYLIPINNPDGYVYTWTDERLWRKNRSKYPENLCYGVDLNRNLDNHFGGEGTSNNSCADTYHGPSPASEPETQVYQNSLLNAIQTQNLQILFSIHSYSQLWMYPYGWTTTLPPNAAELDALAATGVQALTAVHGTQYVYGPIAVTIYPAAGGTIDFAYDNGVTKSFALELRDKGAFGFLLPAVEITPTGEETWAGIIACVLAA